MDRQKRIIATTAGVGKAALRYLLSKGLVRKEEADYILYTKSVRHIDFVFLGFSFDVFVSQKAYRDIFTDERKTIKQIFITELTNRELLRWLKLNRKKYTMLDL